MTKHQKIFNQMLKENKNLFAEFDKIYQCYNLDPQTHQQKFNKKGEQIKEIIQKYENRLCGRSEKGIYANFSASLAEKFWNLIRQKYPKIDFVGVKISQAPARKTIFDIPKIRLE